MKVVRSPKGRRSTFDAAVSSQTTGRASDDRARSGRPTRSAYGSADRRPIDFGHELSDDEGEEGHDGDDEGEGDRLGVIAEERDAGDVGREAPGEGGATERGSGRSHDGDADLDGGEEPLRVVAQRLHGARGAAALLDELLEPGLAERDDRDLRAGEDPVRHDEREDDSDLDEDVVQRGSLRSPACTGTPREANTTGRGGSPRPVGFDRRGTPHRPVADLRE